MLRLILTVAIACFACDPTSGTYATVSASEAKTGARSVATGGERVIVVDGV